MLHNALPKTVKLWTRINTRSGANFSRRERLDEVSFEVYCSDLERKTLGTKGKRYSKRGKQPTLLTRTKSKRNYNTRSRRIRKPTELGQEVRLGRNKERSVPEKGKSQSGERNDLRRSTRLKAQVCSLFLIYS